MIDTLNQLIELKTVSGKNKKKEVVKKYSENKDFLTLLNLLLNDRFVTGIGKSKIDRVISRKEWLPTLILLDIDDAIEYLSENNTGKDEVVINLYCFAVDQLQDAGEQRDSYVNLFMDIISKRYKLGIGAKSVNEVIPDFIDVFDVMLAKSWNKDKYGKQLKEHGATLTIKLDGIRGVVIKRSDDDIVANTREGNIIKGLSELLEKYKGLPNGVYDGELICKPFDGEKTEDLFRRTTSTVNSDDEVTNVQHIVFEYITIEEWDNQKCNLLYLDRLDRLKSLFNNYEINSLIRLISIIKVTHSVDEIDELLDIYTDQGFEGIMINLHNKKYKWNRSDSLLKAKLFDSADLLVLDVLEGDHKYIGSTGALLLQWRDGYTIEVGTGLTDEDRTNFYNNKESIIGKIVEIEYQKESQDKNGNLSVRFPSFKGVRHDKTEKDIRFSDKD